MAGSIEIKGVFASWKLTVEQRTPIPDTELIRLRLESPEPASPPHLVLSWSIPKIDMQISWCESKGFSHNIPPNWCGYNHSNLVSSLPLLLLAAQQGENRFLFAVSETLRPVGFKAGVREEDNRIECSVELFREPEAPIRSCQAELRFDFRKIFYADAIRDAMEWFAAFPECIPSLSPPAAFEPFYSSWYSYHQNISDRGLEAECAVAREYGLKGLIVDDGWQTDDTGRSYAFCGDWEVSAGRFPDMKAHVKKIHELGMKYLLWFPLPFIGTKAGTGAVFRENSCTGSAIPESASLIRAFRKSGSFWPPPVKRFCGNGSWTVSNSILSTISVFRAKIPPLRNIMPAGISVPCRQRSTACSPTS